VLLPTPIAFAAPIKWQGISEIAEGRGEKGPWQQNESRYDYVDDPAKLHSDTATWKCRSAHKRA
jgi:hypothetical protein